MSDETDVDQGISMIEKEVGNIDILINNAGIIKRFPFLKKPVPDFKQVLEINLISPLIVSKRVVPNMIKNGGGKIINICSMMSEYGRNSVSAYASAKGGLKLLTRNMCCEWAKYNIQVNGIGPGYMDIPSQLTDTNADGTADQLLDRFPFRQNPPLLIGCHEQKILRQKSRKFVRIAVLCRKGWTILPGKTTKLLFGLMVCQRLFEQGDPTGLISSGIDCRLKRVFYPIINKWYKKDESGGSYHQDDGEGLDNFHVGTSRDAGNSDPIQG